MKKWVIVVFFLIVLIIIGSGTYLYKSAMKPINTAEEIAVEIAEKETKLVSVEDFTVYNGKDSYYVIKGKKNFNVDIYVLINKETQDVMVKQAQHGITSDEALQLVFGTTIPDQAKVQLGMENRVVYWEVSYLTDLNTLSYYYIDFETGEILKIIENL